MTLLPDEFGPVNDVMAEIEEDPELQQMLLKSEEDLAEGKVYSPEEAFQYVRNYHSKQ